MSAPRLDTKIDLSSDEARKRAEDVARQEADELERQRAAALQKEQEASGRNMSVKQRAQQQAAHDRDQREACAKEPGAVPGESAFTSMSGGRRSGRERKDGTGS